MTKIETSNDAAAASANTLNPERISFAIAQAPIHTANLIGRKILLGVAGQYGSSFSAVVGDTILPMILRGPFDAQ
jgi:hypothetical protein